MAIQEQEEEEVVTMNLGLNNNNDLSYIAKGKRTKRQRPQSPIIIAMNTSLSTRNDDEEKHQTSVSPTSSSIGFTVTDSTEEEEDMANCLILLAKGHNFQNSKQERRNGGVSMEKFNSSSRRFSEIAGGDSSKSSGFFVYECKTCNRCFSSFQALGGHRASHKRPKNMVDQTQVDKKSLVLAKDDQINNQLVQFSNNQTQILNTHLQISNVRTSIGSNKSKVHECSICGSEFSSGQALGGHMRRHRTTTTTTTNTSSNHNDSNSVIVTSSESEEGQKKSRNILSLDLNLPAPEDDREGKFNFGSKQSLVFSATSLVDCHY